MYKKEEIRLFFVIVLETGINFILKSRIVLGVVTSYYVSRTKNKIDQKAHLS